VRFSTLLLAALIGFSSFQLAEAKQKKPKIQHVSQRKIKKGKKPKKFKTAKFKPGKYKTPKQKKPKKTKWGVKHA
jgi:hypothetical protein